MILKITHGICKSWNEIDVDWVSWENEKFILVQILLLKIFRWNTNYEKMKIL